MSRSREQDRFRPASQAPGTFDRIKAAAGIIAVVLLLLFFVQNLQDVKVNFLFFTMHTRLLWALLVSAAFGAIGTFLVGVLRGRSDREE